MGSSKDTIKQLFPGLPQRRKEPEGVVIDPNFDMYRYLPFRLHRVAIQLGYVGTGTSSASFQIDGLDGIDLKVGDWRLIALLAATGPLTHTEIVEMVGMKAATISRAISRMTESGVLVSTDIPSDKRKVLWSLTKEGAELFNAVAPLRKKAFQKLEACLTEEEQDIFYLILDKFDARLKELKFKQGQTEISWD